MKLFGRVEHRPYRCYEVETAVQHPTSKRAAIAPVLAKRLAQAAEHEALIQVFCEVHYFFSANVNHVSQLHSLTRRHGYVIVCTGHSERKKNLGLGLARNKNLGIGIARNLEVNSALDP